MDFRRGCTGKKVYTTFNAAKKGAIRSTRAYENRLRPYACNACGKYHAGATPPKRQRGPATECSESGYAES